MPPPPKPTPVDLPPPKPKKKDDDGDSSDHSTDADEPDVVTAASEALGGATLVIEKVTQRFVLNSAPWTRVRPVFAVTDDGRIAVISGTTQLFCDVIGNLHKSKVQFPDDGVGLLRLEFKDKQNVAPAAPVTVLEARFARKDASSILSTLALLVTRTIHGNSSAAAGGGSGGGAVVPARNPSSIHVNRPSSATMIPRSPTPSATAVASPGGGFDYLQQQHRTLCIAHFNDSYNLAPTSMRTTIVGGAARFHTVLQSLRAAGKHPLVLFSGDFVGPSLMSVETRGRHMVDAFNLLGVDFASVGNHEFDHTLQNFKECLWGAPIAPFQYNGTSTTWVSTNLVDPATMKPLLDLEPYVIVKWGDVRVGIIGLVENWVSGCGRLKPGELKYLDIFEIGERVALELKHRGAEFVIALTHCRIGLDLQVSQRCPSIDLILGGHDHFYRSRLKHRVVKSGEEFKYLSEVNVTFLPGVTQPTVTCRTHEIHKAIAPSPVMDALIKAYDDRVKERMDVTVGTTAVVLDPTEEAVRFHEGYLSSFFCDIMADETNSDIALLGAAAISGKTFLAPGDIKFGDILNWFPGNPKVMSVRINGKTLRKLIQTMAADCPQEAPSFPHCSADLSFVINVIMCYAPPRNPVTGKVIQATAASPPVEKRPAKIENLMFRGQPVQDDQMFDVALEDFAAKGKGHYKFLKTEAQQLVDEESAEQLVDWVVNYFVEKKGQLKSMQQQQQAALRERAAKEGAMSKGMYRHNQPAFARRPTATIALDGFGGVIRRRQHQTRTSASHAGGGGAGGGGGGRSGAGGAGGGGTTTSTHAPGGDRVSVETLGTTEWLNEIDRDMLTAVYATLSEMLEPVDSIKELVERLQRLFCAPSAFDCDRIRLLLNDEAGACMRHYNYEGDYVNSMPLAAGGIAAICCTRRVVMRTNNVKTDDFFDPDEDVLPGEAAGSTRTMLSAPAGFQEKPVLVVQLINKSIPFGGGESLARFSDDDREMLAFLARQLAQHIVATQYYTDLIRAEHSTQQLMHIASSIVDRSMTHSLTEVMSDVQTRAAELLHCEQCQIFLVQSGGGSLFAVPPANLTASMRAKAAAAAQQARAQQEELQQQAAAFQGAIAAAAAINQRNYRAVNNSHNNNDNNGSSGSSSAGSFVGDADLAAAAAAAVTGGGGGGSGHADPLVIDSFGGHSHAQQQPQPSLNATVAGQSASASGATADGGAPSAPRSHGTASNAASGPELQFRDSTKGIIGAAVTQGQTIVAAVAGEHEEYNAEFDAAVLHEKKSCMVMPLQSSRGRDVVIGALTFSSPSLPGQTRFQAADVRLGEDFATFCSIAIEQVYEVQRLHVNKEGMLQAFPSINLGRVQVKAGWATLARWIRSLTARRRKTGTSGGGLAAIRNQQSPQQQQAAAAAAAAAAHSADFEGVPLPATGHVGVA